MPVRKRNLTRRAQLDADEAAWLVGDRVGAGIVQFMADEKLSALWESHGDTDCYRWSPGMLFPEVIG